MATEDEECLAEAASPTSDVRGKSPAEAESRKRKLSSAQSSDEGTAKRSKRDETPLRPKRDETPLRSISSEYRPKSRDAKQSLDQGRRPSAATDEEKQRSKRLFGGLMNTLGQGVGNSQQRRRQEIERRQRDKMQLQAAEDEKKRAEKRATLHDVRMEQQITWEEQVVSQMRSRHAKMLKLAQFLHTKSKPELHYLPRRPSRREEDVIEAQVRDCKAGISRELESFKSRKEQHLKLHGPTGDPGTRLTREEPATPEKPSTEKPSTEEPSTEEPLAEEPPAEEPPAEEPPAKEHAARVAGDDVSKTIAPVHDMHDESGDVLVEADEDTVIY